MGQAISSTQFFVTGYLKHVKSYTEPYQTSAIAPTNSATSTTTSASSNAVDNDGVDLTGKVYVITGANSGLGFAVSKYVASKGGTLFMMCRSQTRADAARDVIIQETADAVACDIDVAGNVHVVIADVSVPAAVRSAVETIQSKTNTVHCLVCNAGVLLNEQQTTAEPEKYEMTFASHFLGGTYLLTKLLLPQLSAATTDSDGEDSKGDGRVVIVTSAGMYNYGLPDWDTLTSYTIMDSDDDAATKKKSAFKYDGTDAYAYAKRAQVIVAEEWTKEYATTNDVKFVTAHPGWSDTAAVTDAFGDLKKYLQPLREPWQGAEGIAWCATTSSSNLQSGALYLDRSIQKKHIGGPFMTEGTHTKNSDTEIKEFMNKLQQTVGI